MSAATRILFFLFALTLFCGILFMGMPVAQEQIGDRQHRDLFLLATALQGITGAVLRRKTAAIQTRLDRVLLAAAVAMPCYVLLQWIPLPAGLVGILSPARGELLRGLEPLFGHRTFASLSIVPSATFSHFLLIAAYGIILLAAREFTLQSGRWLWLLTAPVVAAGVIEAAMALIQLSTPNAPVRGTFGVRNHLAGFLAMAWPLAAMYGMSALRADRRRGHSAVPRWSSIAGFGLAALILAGAFATASRGGFLSILASSLVMAVFAVGRDTPIRKRLLTVSALLVAVIILFLYLTPLAMITRLAEHSSEGRTTVWREGLGIIREFPLFGCGMGGFQSAFAKFKAAEGTFLVDYAHNDYLQTFAELGLAGFLIAALLAGSVILRTIRRVGEIGETRWVGLACLGSLTAIAIHSTVDFNLYVAANAAIVAWIAGIAAGLAPSAPRIVRRRRNESERTV